MKIEDSGANPYVHIVGDMWESTMKFIWEMKDGSFPGTVRFATFGVVPKILSKRL